jgi:hypothetical protein
MNMNSLFDETSVSSEYMENFLQSFMIENEIYDPELEFLHSFNFDCDKEPSTSWADGAQGNVTMQTENQEIRDPCTSLSLSNNNVSATLALNNKEPCTSRSKGIQGNFTMETENQTNSEPCTSSSLRKNNDSATLALNNNEPSTSSSIHLQNSPSNSVVQIGGANNSTDIRQNVAVSNNSGKYKIIF